MIEEYSGFYAGANIDFRACSSARVIAPLTLSVIKPRAAHTRRFTVRSQLWPDRKPVKAAACTCTEGQFAKKWRSRGSTKLLWPQHPLT